MALTKPELLAYLEGHARDDLSEVDEDTELFSSGLIDSFAMVDLLLFLEKHTGAKINLIEHVEAKLLGGLVIRVGDEQVDASVAHQLRRFRDAMLDHASRHIHAGTEKFFEGTTAE